MGTFKKFEEMDVWKKSRGLTNQIYLLTSKNGFVKDYCLKDQMRRAAISIISNISEGYERDGNREFVQFLSIAKGSSGELRSQLYVALDLSYISNEEFNSLIEKCNEISGMLNSLIRYLRDNVFRGTKFKSEKSK
jgi:four helix bundle protein